MTREEQDGRSEEKKQHAHGEESQAGKMTRKKRRGHTKGSKSNSAQREAARWIFQPEARDVNTLL